MAELQEYVAGSIWLLEYPVRFLTMHLTSRMAVIKLTNGQVLLHSPCQITEKLHKEITDIGPVAAIIAPGTFHHLHVEAAQKAFPAAKTYICPGLGKKRPNLAFDGILTDIPPALWADELEQVLVRGNRVISEIAFYHTASKTLILVDLLENIGDVIPDVDWKIKLYWKAVFHRWNQPTPAPEYEMGWKDKAAARASILKILAFDFERIVISHGPNIDADAHQVARRAWAKPLGEPRS